MLLPSLLLGSVILLHQASWTCASPAPPPPPLPGTTPAPAASDLATAEARSDSPTPVTLGEATSILLPDSRVTVAIEVQLADYLEIANINKTLDHVSESVRKKPQTQQVPPEKKYKWSVSLSEFYFS